ncbi:MAG: TonB-dependent receptor [Hyphomonadaceae bacterium]|nr:TonB-dependent receptor [Hyphomonadaceae bacterium]
MSDISTRALTLALASIAGFSLTAGAGAAYAQAQEASAGDEIVVTGTRVVGRSRLDTIAPVDVLTSEALSEQGTTELAQALAVTLPALTFPRPAITDGTDSVRPATLRGLAPDQTLVLVNSHRRHASALVNINGSIGRGSAAVDLNAIPAAAISSVEVLRDGASAQYGSDAIAGVVNLRLREANSGGGASVTYGKYITDVTTTRLPERREEDGGTTTVQGWAGLPFFNDGFLTISGEYLQRDPTSRGDRDPRITSAAQSPTGSLVTSRFGDPTVDQGTVYLNAGMPLNADGWSLYGWLGYQQRETDSAANPRLPFVNGAENTASNVLSVTPQGFLPLIAPTITDLTGAIGVNGELGGFEADFGFVYGNNRIEYQTINTLNVSIARAQTTAGNPLSGGTPQRSFDSGALEYAQWVANASFARTFEAGLAAPVTLAFGFEYRNEEYTEEAGERASYDIARNPTTGVAIPGIVGQGGSQGFPGLQSTDATNLDRHAWSAYVEAEANVTERLLVSAAARLESYSDFGETLNGKLSTRYDFTDWFALRGTVSSGFRAPSMQQQAFTATSTNFINGIPVDILTTPASSALSAALGGKPLTPEESVSYSAGGVFRAGGFELTIDAYRIEITDRIVLSENIQGANVASPTTPAQITQRAIFNLISPLSPTATAARFFINGVDSKTEGVDVVARYRLNTEAAGDFAFTASGNINATDVTRTPTTSVLAALPVPPVLFPTNRVWEFERGTPAQKYSLAVDWDLEPFGATIRGTHYGSVLAPQASLPLTYKLDSAFLLDLEGRVEWNKIGFALGASNVLDEYPTQTPTNVNVNGPTAFSSFSPFGFNGRFVYGRLSYNW